MTDPKSTPAYEAASSPAALSIESLQAQLAARDQLVAQLQSQLQKQQKINAALISRVEAGSDQTHAQLSPYAAFEHAALLAEQVQKRTQELSAAYAELKRSMAYSEDLKASERWIRTITDQVPAMIAYLSSAGRYLFTNLVYDQFYGVSRGSLQDATLLAVHGEVGARRLQPYISQVLAGEDVSFEIDEHNAQGELRHLLKSYVPHRDNHAHVIGFFVLIRDITERKRTSEALRQANLHLEQRVLERTAALQDLNRQLADAHQQADAARHQAEGANRSKSKFLAAVSHDVLQPLNAARLFNGALLDSDLPVYAHEQAQAVARSLDDLAGLMRSLVDLSRLDAGHMTVERRVFALKPLLQRLQQEYAPQAQAKGVGFAAHCAELLVSCDEALLLRVLRNLISNAIRYTPAGGRVLVSARVQAAQVQVRVMDNGIGIAPSLQQQVFSEFFRVDARATEPHQAGLGLGLSIVDKICRLLEIPLTLRSALGRGSCFELRIPKVVTSTAVMSPAETAADGVAERGMIWVVDNDAAIRQAMQVLLQGWGYQVVVASSLADLQQRRGSTMADVLLVDYHLDNGETGLQLARTLRAEQRQTAPAATELPVVMITADQSADLRHLLQQEQGHLLYKPVRPLKLRSLLRSLMTNRGP